MTWDKVMKLRNRIRIFAVIFILALGMEYLPMAVYAAEVTAEESDMANDAEPDMDETPEPDNASETDKEDKTDVQDTGQNIPVTDIEISDHGSGSRKDNKPYSHSTSGECYGKHDNIPFI